MGLFEKFAKELPNVAGKVFVITGTTSGTGYVAAETVAKHGGEVVLLNRPSERSTASLKKLRAAVPDATFVPISCDLMDFSSVRAACAEIKEKYDTIYCLSNNAGIMMTPDEATKDGFDKQMQVNHLSHFLITKELFPLILNGAKKFDDARIVQHSSLARSNTVNGKLEEKYFAANGGNLGGDPHLENGGSPFSGPPMHRYCQTKLANSVFSYALHDKLQSSSNDSEQCKKIRAIAAHPGISKTSLLDHMKSGFFTRKIIFPAVAFFMFQCAEDGAMGLIKGMMDSNVESGKLYGPPKLKGNAILIPPEPYETDEESKKMLWKMSEEATGVIFDI